MLTPATAHIVASLLQPHITHGLAQVITARPPGRLVKLHRGAASVRHVHNPRKHWKISEFFSKACVVYTNRLLEISCAESAAMIPGFAVCLSVGEYEIVKRRRKNETICPLQYF